MKDDKLDDRLDKLFSEESDKRIRKICGGPKSADDLDHPEKFEIKITENEAINAQKFLNETIDRLTSIQSFDKISDVPDDVMDMLNKVMNDLSDIQYSATAGAAFEAAFQGIHTIAFSEDACEIHEVTERYLKEIIAELLNKPLGVNKIWNVNFPGCQLAECNGILRDRKVSTDAFYVDRYIETTVSEDKVSYMVEGIRNYSALEGTDLKAIFDNYISIGIATNIS